jgi:hypothetical protein
MLWLQAHDLESFPGDSTMVAAEFQAKVVAGKIEVPEALQGQFHGEVNVILFANGAQGGESVWPEQNRRRWELIAKMVRQGLTVEETRELATLQNRADEQLAQVGPRPTEQLEKLYAELVQEG